MRHPFFLLGALALSTFSASAQIAPGHSLSAVSVTGVGGEMYDVDHTTRTATKLTISGTLLAEQVSSILMTSPGTGYLGTTSTGATANLYSFIVVGTTVTETKLNTTATKGVNCAQMAIVGPKLYFCVQDPSGTVGWIQSMLFTGGAVTDELDLSTLGALGLANALCQMNGKIYCATFNSSPGNTAPTPGELIEYDPVAQTGKLVMKLPLGKFDPVGNPWNTGIVNMREDPLQPGVLALLGVYGDLLHINPATATVVRHDWTGTKNAGGNSLASGSVDAFSWDPVAQDWVVATRYGSIEHWVHDQQAEKKITGIGSHATPTSNRMTAIHYVPFVGGGDVSYGPGCQGNGTWEPTDSSIGQPVAGNSAFKLGLFAADGGDLVIGLIGLRNTMIGAIPLPFDLAAIGATPGCFLRTDILLTLAAVASGTGPGEGQVVVGLPIPPDLAGARIYRQWLALQVNPTNPAGVVVSNARQMDIR